MVPEMSLFQNPSLHSQHLRKSVNPHRHCATDTSTRKLSNRTRRAEHGNPSPQPKQITIMAINTTSLIRHWPNLAREKDITHGGSNAERGPAVVLGAIHEGRQDKCHLGTADGQTGRRTAGIRRNMCYIQTACFFDSFFESSDYHETLRWLLTTKRVLMVKISIGNGSKNATLMVVYAHPGEARKHTRRMNTSQTQWWA